MAVPTTRDEFKEHCLRRLGKPVINIEVTEEQVDDRVDEALKYYWDYHFSGSMKEYYKYQVTQADRADRVKQITINDGGTGYDNTDVIVLSGGGGSNAAATLTTDGTGTITTITMTDNGDGYAVAPDISITTGTGSGASLTPELGGWIPIPENIIGAVKVWPLGDSLSSNQSIFNIRYQIALNDLYTLTSTSMVPYYSAFTHIRLIEEILVGKKFIRFNRHRDRVYVDIDWNLVVDGEYLLVEAYQVVDPEVYPDVWSDRWLQRYTTALIKRQWGYHLTKHTGMQMAGGIEFNGKQILQDAYDEITKLEDEMIVNNSLPVLDFIG